MVTNAKSLDCRVTLRRATYTTSPLNTQIATWADLDTVWAEQSYRNASESDGVQQLRATLESRFVIRWSSIVADLNPKDRIMFDDREYDIKQVLPIGRRQWLEIHAVARAD